MGVSSDSQNIGTASIAYVAHKAASRRRSRSRRSWRSVSLARPMRSSILAASEQRVQPSTCRTSDRHASRGTQRKQQGTDVNLEIDGRGCNIISITHKAFLFCPQFVARMSLFNIRLPREKKK